MKLASCEANVQVEASLSPFHRARMRTFEGVRSLLPKQYNTLLLLLIKEASTGPQLISFI